MKFPCITRLPFGGLALALAFGLAAALSAQTTPTPGNANNATTLTPITLAPAAGGAMQPAAADHGPDIHDLHDAEWLTFWQRYGLLVVAGSVLGITLLALLIMFLLRKKPAVTLTAYQRAIVELARARELQSNGQDKAFAIAASDAVRHYLEDAYRMPAPERTTEEFLLEAAHHAWLQGELTVLLKRFLEFCDLAKFAGQQFGEEESEKLLAAARDFLGVADKLLHPESPATHPTGPTLPPPAKPTLSTP